MEEELEEGEKKREKALRRRHFFLPSRLTKTLSLFFKKTMNQSIKQTGHWVGQQRSSGSPKSTSSTKKKTGK